MDNSLIEFTFEDFAIKGFEQDGQAWFIGKQIAEALGYRNTRDALAYHVDEEDRGVARFYTPGGEQTMVTINEFGVYSLILSSKLDKAKKFKRWIITEVLPSIRNNGYYARIPDKELIEVLTKKVEDFPTIIKRSQIDREAQRKILIEVMEKRLEKLKQNRHNISEQEFLDQLVFICGGFEERYNKEVREFYKWKKREWDEFGKNYRLNERLFERELKLLERIEKRIKDKYKAKGREEEAKKIDIVSYVRHLEWDA